ncbi:MAG: S-layer protein domain-containing protein [Candidatus Methanoperedens sp.]|nr:S-layer protein domain-containing protein [Candidatus Methanoperedens sp.]
MIGTVTAIVAMLLIWGASLITVDNQGNMDDSRVNNLTQPESITIPEKLFQTPKSAPESDSRLNDLTQPETGNITILEKQFRMPVSPPGSRYIWDGDAGGGSTFNLTPMNFDGFYYDLDNNAGSESFIISLGNPRDKSIQENDLKYSTAVSNIPFKYRSFGNYTMIGFMGERYFTGYTDDSKFAHSPVNLLNHRMLLGILMDENANHTLTAGSGMALSDGYAILVNSVNIDERTVQISLNKNGEEIDSRSVKAGETYVYNKDIRKVKTISGYLYDTNISVGNLPIIAINIDSVLSKGNFPAITINGIFQLSDTAKIDLESGDHGLMKITNFSDNGISMVNAVSLELRYPYSTEFERHSSGIMGDMGLEIADSDILRFSAVKDSVGYGNHERRGAVFTESNPVMAWDGLNFAGFLYDLDTGIYSQRLEITNISGRSIPVKGLKYTAFVTEVPFAVKKKTGLKPSGTSGSYKAIGFGTDNYAVIKGNSSLIAQILIDNGTHYLGKKTLVDGGSWQLGEGYALTVRAMDLRGYPRKAQLALSRNGVELENMWLESENVYTYTIPGENGMPKLVTYLDAVFAGTMTDLIQLRYTWFISDDIIQIKVGDRSGVFRVTSVASDFIVLENDREIDLSPGSCINLIGNLGFVVADSEELRFYPSGGKKCDQSG